MEDTAQVVGAKVGGKELEEQTQTRVCVCVYNILHAPGEKRNGIVSEVLESFSDIIVISF